MAQLDDYEVCYGEEIEEREGGKLVGVLFDSSIYAYCTGSLGSISEDFLRIHKPSFSDQKKIDYHGHA